MSLRHYTIACHCVLMLALAGSALGGGDRLALRALAAAAVLAPLLLTLRGLARSRRSTEQDLAVLLVLYIGGASVEVVATSGSAVLASGALLAAALELGLLLTLIRRRSLHPRDARE